MKIVLHLGRAASVCAALVLFAGGLLAQTNTGTATISGTVADVTGKAISNAAVSIRNEGSGASKFTATDQAGKYSITGLPDGSYSVEAAAPSFSLSKRAGVKVTSGTTADVNMSLNVSELAQSVTVEGSVTLAAESAISQSTLEARSAKSEISPEFIQNFASPVADYSELLNMAPGTFSVNPNGVGLGDSKTFFRGFKDGQYTMQADGIPFNDTNDPTHHSWAFFPSQFIAGVEFDRSPGSAATIGPQNFGGTINLLSRSVSPAPGIRGTASYGSFNTRMLALDGDSGWFGPGKRSSLSINIHQLLSDGFQTYNYQKRVAGFIKYQYRITDRTTFTMFFGTVDLWTNTPNTKGPTRDLIAQFGDNYLMSGDPKRADYYGYNFYHVQTDFGYLGLHSDLGHGWKFDNKAYTYRYWNKQNYNSATSISATSATDKLNGYRKAGDILQVSKDTRLGIFRTGLWYEWAYTDRYQVPSDPRTWVDAALPNFHEHFITNSMQPYAEFEYFVTRKISLTGGLKFSDYGMHLTQFRDNGKTVGGLGGAPSVFHETDYRSYNPSADIRYKIKNNWTTYAQFSTGSVIPPSSVFDSAGAQVAVLPKPTLVKTYQLGSVYKRNRFTLDWDAYYSHFQNGYGSLYDAKTGESYFYQTSPSNTKGTEVEANVILSYGFSMYLNGTLNQTKYQGNGLWVANSPKNTEGIGLTYRHRNWDVGVLNKRVGPMYNDNGTFNQAVPIDPFNITNFFFNYTIKGDSLLRGTKLKFGINNLFNNQSIVGIAPAVTSQIYKAAGGDTLTITPPRSISLTMTFGYSPRYQ